MDDTNTQNHSDSSSAAGSSFFGARLQPDEKLIEAPPVPEMIESVEEDGQASSQTSPVKISSETPSVTLSEESARISYTDAKVTEIPIEQIVPNPYQPRKTFDPVQLQELANSIAEHGVIQPLVVNQTERGYELVVGERRFRASQIAGLKMVPVIVKAGMQDQAKLEIALIENIQRQELNPIEEAMAYDKLMKSFGLTQEQVAKKVGKSRPAVANTVRLLNLPVEIQRALIEGKISEGHARAVLGLPGSERQLALFKMIIDQGMNVRQVEAKVRELLSRPRLESAGPADPKTQAMESELRSKLGTQVRIEKRGSGGKITIDFFSDQELSELVGKLEGNSNSSDYFTV
jgi:ParB family chromosome partitioning protein